MTPIGAHTMAHATLVDHGDDQLEVKVILGPRHLINAPIGAIVPARPVKLLCKTCKNREIKGPFPYNRQDSCKITKQEFWL